MGGGQKSHNFADVIVANKHVKSCDTFLSQRQAEGSDTTFVLAPDRPRGFVILERDLPFESIKEVE